MCNVFEREDVLCIFKNATVAPIGNTKDSGGSRGTDDDVSGDTAEHFESTM